MTAKEFPARLHGRADAPGPDAARAARPAGTPLAVEGQLPSLDGATGWLNSPPLTPEGLRGQVVLVEFGTYTCINWIRTLPYVRAWAEKYSGPGLVVILAHTPEFSFEANPDNVRPALRDMRADFPVAVDSDYGVWSAFGNHYWPALYFIDAEGRIRHHQFGEGEYERSERVIQQLLAEAGLEGAGSGLVSVQPEGVEVAADWATLGSPENYLGYERTEGFESPGGAVPGQRHVYAVPERLRLNEWALAGDWTSAKHAVTLNEVGGRVVYQFRARDVHLVMGPAARGSWVEFRVLLDGRPPGGARGSDVDTEGHGTVTAQRLYQLIRQPGPITGRTLEIEFLDPGVEGYVFTFG